MTNFKSMLRFLSLVFGVGYVLYFFSEKVFWSLWRPVDDVMSQVGGLVAYSFFAYVLLVMLRHFRVWHVWALLLVGALFGWLVEGIFAMTLFGDVSMPFPFTIAWTGLAWHMPISVMIGFYLLYRVMQRDLLRCAFWLNLCLGMFWGFWGTGWGMENPPVVATTKDFFIHAVGATFLLGLAFVAINYGRPHEFKPSRTSIIVMLALIIAYGALVMVPQVPWSPLLLTALVGPVLYVLKRHKEASQASIILQQYAVPLYGRNLAMLIVMPIAATTVYVGLRSMQIPAHSITCVVTSLAGFVLLLVALRITFKKSTYP